MLVLQALQVKIQQKERLNKMAEQNSGMSFFVVGLGIGVAVGMLLAPRSGEERTGKNEDWAKGQTDCRCKPS